MSKDAGMRIRVEKELRAAFVQACRAQDRPAASVLRDFMRSFTQIKQHRKAKHFSDFERDTAKNAD